MQAQLDFFQDVLKDCWYGYWGALPLLLFFTISFLLQKLMDFIKNEGVILPQISDEVIPQIDDNDNRTYEETFLKSNMFEVEKIMGMKVEKGVKYFKIRWIGYSPEDDTWEREENLDCDARIAEYLATKKSSKNGGKRSKHDITPIIRLASVEQNHKYTLSKFLKDIEPNNEFIKKEYY